MRYLIVASLSLLGSAGLVAFLLSGKRKFFILDHPNERSLHSVPTPRTGGIAICLSIVGIGILVAILFDTRSSLIWLLSAIFIVVLVSFFDDKYDINVGFRLFIHGLSAGLLILGGYQLRTIQLPGWELELSTGFSVILSFFFTLWMINLYNFMDGIDGLAGGMAAFGFLAFGLFGLMANEALFSALCFVVAASSGGFLLFNFPPAKIFMGDIGSSLLGLLAAAFTLWGGEKDIFPFWIGVLVFSPFIVDTTVTLIQRLFRGEKIWCPHRMHYYQKMVQYGWGHKRTVLWEYTLMLACACTALIAIGLDVYSQWLVIMFWSIVFLSIIRKISGLNKNMDKDNSFKVT